MLLVVDCSLTRAHLILSLTPSSLGAMNGGMPARSMYAMTPMLQQSQACVARGRAFSVSFHARMSIRRFGQHKRFKASVLDAWGYHPSAAFEMRPSARACRFYMI